MNQIIFGLILTVVLVTPVFARDATPSARPVRWEQIEQRREDMRQRLETIRDEKKRQILEHISNQIKLLSARIPKAMLRHL